MRKNCEGCGKVFECSERGHFCRKCVQRIQSETAKRRNLNKIGNDAYSAQQKRRRENNGQSIC